MKTILLGLTLSVAINAPLAAQTRKLPVYGEIGLGVGKTLFRGDAGASLQKALGGSSEFKPCIGNNLMMGFYVAPNHWHGLGVGSRIRGTFGVSSPGSGNETYIFNYYNVALSAKYYPSGQFNRGVYGRGSFGFGQFTTKRLIDDSRTYVHQYGIGSSVMLGVGYSVPLKSTSLSLEAEWESARRNGTVNTIGDVVFRTGQLGVNLILTY